ncbi:hypothetical protein ACFYYM_39225 [Streptomyces erythrochromogenes]|uniref:hypothetical protein n=1 Tax=Streptomyces erythrochromogenes TaxID=285574 RepID=UPI0036908E4F
MAGGELTPQETAVWDQLLAELDGGRVQAGRRQARSVLSREIVLALLLVIALFMLLGGSFSGSGLLAWSGVIAWVSVVLIISHRHGHGPRLPMR